MAYQHLSNQKLAEIKDSFPNAQNLDALVKVFKIFADSTRLKIILTLLDNELCVHDIERVVGISQSAISHQLRNLRDAKMVKFRREGKEVIYSLDVDHVRQIFDIALAYIMEIE